jgi:hypothetical protein
MGQSRTDEMEDLMDARSKRLEKETVDWLIALEFRGKGRVVNAHDLRDERMTAARGRDAMRHVYQFMIEGKVGTHEIQVFGEGRDGDRSAGFFDELDGRAGFCIDEIENATSLSIAENPKAAPRLRAAGKRKYGSRSEHSNPYR